MNKDFTADIEKVSRVFDSFDIFNGGRTQAIAPNNSVLAHFHFKYPLGWGRFHTELLKEMVKRNLHLFYIKEDGKDIKLSDLKVVKIFVNQTPLPKNTRFWSHHIYKELK